MTFPQSYIIKCNATEEFKNKYPTLDEWQVIIRTVSQLKNITDYELLSKLRIGIAQSCCDGYLRTQTIYDYYIIWYMHVKYDKSWYNGAGQWK